jgi:two-component system, OmpR family, sensor histidine kinase MprB
VSLRSRFAALAAAAVVAAVVTASFLAWFLARDAMLAEIDDRLNAQAQLTTRIVEQVEAGTRPPPALLSAIQPVPIGVQLVTADGDTRSPVVGAGINLPADDALASALSQQSPEVNTTTSLAHGERWRVVTMPLRDGGAIRVARSLGEFDAALWHLGVRLAILATAGGIIAGSAAFLVASRGLRPVAELTAAADRVARTKDLGSRFTAVGHHEIARLAQAVNHMLEELEDAKTRQRELVEEVGHEVRTPLTSVRANVDILDALERRAPEVQHQERPAVIEELRTACDSLSRLTTEVIELAGGDQPDEEMVEVDVDVLLHEAICQARLGTSAIDIHVDGTSGGVVIAYATALQRAVANLIRNALLWSPSGESVLVTIIRRAETLEFRVADRGPGVADAEKSYIFDRFYRGSSRSAPPGSGLGLAIVKHTAQAHHGGVHVEDRPGGGSIFSLWVTIPAAPAEPR